MEPLPASSAAVEPAKGSPVRPKLARARWVVMPMSKQVPVQE